MKDLELTELMNREAAGRNSKIGGSANAISLVHRHETQVVDLDCITYSYATGADSRFSTDWASTPHGLELTEVMECGGASSVNPSEFITDNKTQR